MPRNDLLATVYHENATPVPSRNSSPARLAPSARPSPATSSEPTRPMQSPAAVRAANRSFRSSAAHTAISTGSRPTMIAAMAELEWLMPR